MNNELITLIFNIVFFAGIWWLYFVEYKAYKVDLVRQRLFRIRDDLFEYTRNNDELSFDSKAYTQMRTTANGMIHFAHKVSLLSLVSTVLADKIYNKGNGASQFENSMETALSDLSKETRGTIHKMRNTMHLTLAKHIIFSSSILSLLFVLASALRISHKVSRLLIFGKGHNKTKRRWSSIDAAAEEIGTCRNTRATA